MATINRYIAYFSFVLNVLYWAGWIFAFNQSTVQSERVALFESMFLDLDIKILSLLAIILTIWSFAFFFFGKENRVRKILGIIQIVFLLMLGAQYL